MEVQVDQRVQFKEATKDKEPHRHIILTVQDNRDREHRGRERMDQVKDLTRVRELMDQVKEAIRVREQMDQDKEAIKVRDQMDRAKEDIKDKEQMDKGDSKV